MSNLQNADIGADLQYQQDHAQPHPKQRKQTGAPASANRKPQEGQASGPLAKVKQQEGVGEVVKKD